MSAHAEMEAFFSCHLDEVLVGADTGGFESLRAQLLILVGYEVDAAREFIEFARLRPRSKMRIFGSGTPRLKRDFGYGCTEAVC